MISTEPLRRSIALVFALLMITSVMAPIAGATGASELGAEVGDTSDWTTNIGNESAESPSDGAAVDNAVTETDGAVVDDAIAEANGTVEVVVRLDETDRSLEAQSEAAVVANLRDHADTSQKPVLEFATGTDGVDVLNRFWLTNAVLLELDTDRVDVTDLAAQEGVTDVHANAEFTAPEPASLSPLEEDEDETTYGIDQINATEVWAEYDTKGEGVQVAVLDTGVDPDHPDIDIDPDNWAEFDGSGEQVDSEPHDTAYHGTHVSGTIAGGNASSVQIGVAPEAELMHGLVIPDGGGSFAQIIAGMEWAVEENADVVSMSLGATGYHPEMIDPVQNAITAGTVVVSSSGNDGEGTSGSPANVYEAFAIGMADEDANIDQGSSGEQIVTDTAWGFDAPDDWPDEYVVPNVAAPGVDVISSVPSGTFDDPDAIWASATGTSMAAPHVSGSLALLLSATDEELSAEQQEALLEATAWKPDGEPDEQDVRYGHGIVDAKGSIDRIEADGGVAGTVTDPDGEAIEGATVSLGGFVARTDADGTYAHSAGPGEYELAVDAYGYHADSSTVTVTEDEVTEHDVSLERALEVEIVEDQPRAIAAGETVAAEIEAVHVESVTVDVDGYDEGAATLYLDGEETEFGETVEFGELVSDTVDVQVETAADESGELELEYTFEGVGETTAVTTGPTGIFEEPTEVAVVAPEDEGTGQLEAFLDDALDLRFQLTPVTVEEALGAIDDGTYDAYVVQSLGTDHDRTDAFVEASRSPDVGVVYLEQDGAPTDAIGDLSAATDNPRTVEQYVDFGNSPINYVVESDHPVFDGVASEGDDVELYTPTPVVGAGYFHAYYKDYEGHLHSEDLAMTAIEETTRIPGFPPITDTVETGVGLSVEDNNRVVLAASLAPSVWVEPEVYTPDAERILENAVEFASSPPPAYVEEPPAERVDPGESVSVDLTADGLDRVKVEVADGSLDEDDLSLYVDGSINAFGEYRALEEPTDVDGFEISVVTDDDAVGDVAFDVTTDTVGEDGETERTEIATGTTAVYETPLEVGPDGALETLAGALEIVAPNDEIVLDDGLYENVADTDDVYDPGYVVETSGVTIRAAESATPVVTFGDSSGDLSNDVFDVRADDVAIENVNVNAYENGTAVGDFTALYSGGYDGLTVSNATIAGDRGVYLEETEGVTIRDTEVTELVGFSAINTRSPVREQGIPGGLNENLLVDNVTSHDLGSLAIDNRTFYMSDSEDVVVRNSEFAGGMDFTGSDGVTVEDTEIDAHETLGIMTGGDSEVVDTVVTNATAGITAGGPTTYGVTGQGATVTIADNDVSNAETGVWVTDAVDATTVTGNDVDADEGIAFGSPSFDSDGLAPFDVASTELDVHYNDLSATDDGFFVNGTEGDLPIDVRLNYLEAATVDDDALVHTPSLTEPPRDEMPEPDEITTFGVDLSLEAGDTYALGVPGPTTQGLDDVFDDGFEGAAYGFDAESQSWQMLTNGDTLEALEALAVVADSDGHAQLEFTSGDAPSGPGQTTLHEGWNFVTAPTYSGADTAFEHATTDVSLVMHTHDRPEGQIAPAGDLDGLYAGGEDEPRLSAFEGYFVFADDEGTLPAQLASDPTMPQLYEGLGAAEYATIDHAGAESTDAVADVLASDLEDDDLERALVDAMYAELQAGLEENATRADAFDAVDDVRATALERADDDQRVENALESAVILLLVHEFDVATPVESDDGSAEPGLDRPSALRAQ